MSTNNYFKVVDRGGVLAFFFDDADAQGRHAAYLQANSFLSPGSRLSVFRRVPAYPAVKEIGEPVVVKQFWTPLRLVEDRTPDQLADDGDAPELSGVAVGTPPFGRTN